MGLRLTGCAWGFGSGLHPFVPRPADASSQTLCSAPGGTWRFAVGSPMDEVIDRRDLAERAFNDALALTPECGQCSEALLSLDD